MDIVLKISIVLAVGILGGKLASLLKLPSVSGYLVAGVFLGPSLFHFLNSVELTSLEVLSEIALAFIAFSIGNEFVISDMKKVGARIAVITLAEVVGAISLVFFMMYVVFNQSFAFSITIASMSAATAPAATLLVMKQYRANGPLTRTILPVVALDDVYGIMAFGVAIALAKMSVAETAPSISEMIVGPLVEILGSLLLGFVLGAVITFIFKKIKARDDFQVISLVAIGLGIGLSNYFHLSPLLTNIMIGTTLVNLMPRSEKAFNSVNDFVSPFYVLFFTLAGASLDLVILKEIGLIGVAYVFARGAGKMIGAWAGAVSTKSEKTVSRYLGLALLPQGGISIGLSVLVRQQLPEEYSIPITTIIMFSILIYEVSGPIFAKIAISNAGEINGMDRYETKVDEVVESKSAVVSTVALE